MKDQIEDHVFESIRKTINRFREKPFHYFTEADIHSSILNDMLSGSGVLKKRVGEKGIKKTKGISILFVHQEYPANFRYNKRKLLEGYRKEEIELTDLGYFADGKTNGDRGNFELAVLNPDFVERMIGIKKHTLQKALD